MKIVQFSFAILLGAVLLSGCQSIRPKNERVAGSGKALEIPPDFRKRAEEGQAELAEIDPHQTGIVSETDNTTSSDSNAPISGNQAWLQLETSQTPNDVNASQFTPPPNPAMQADTSAATSPDDPTENLGRLRGRSNQQKDDLAEEIDAYSQPVIVPDEFDGLGGGDNNGANVETLGARGQRTDPPFPRYSLSGTEGLRAINVALDAFEYVQMLRRPYEDFQSEIDQILANLIANAMQKFDGEITEDLYLSKRQSEMDKLYLTFDALESRFSDASARLERSPLHNLSLAGSVRQAAAQELSAWRRAIIAQIDLFELHAKGQPRSALRIPSLKLFFPYIKAKSQHLAAAYAFEASAVKGLDRYDIATVPGGTKDLLLALESYNKALIDLLDAATLYECGEEKYRATNASQIIPALNAIDNAARLIPGLDRAVLAEFTPIMINAGLSEDKFVSLRGPLSKALNDLETSTLSLLANGFEPIFIMVEEEQDPARCETEAGAAVMMADHITRIGALSMEEVVDPERQKLFRSARKFYDGLSAFSTKQSVRQTVPPLTNG